MGNSVGRVRIKEQGEVNIQKENQQESDYEKSNTNVVLEGKISSQGMGQLDMSDKKRWEQNKNIEKRNQEINQQDDQQDNIRPNLYYREFPKICSNF